LVAESSPRTQPPNIIASAYTTNSYILAERQIYSGIVQQTYNLTVAADTLAPQICVWFITSERREEFWRMFYELKKEREKLQTKEQENL
jgi:hypothetical protein